jgi:nickel/cobalt transporter (NicO) family protein
MAFAVLYGAGSGALHAVSGPDHVLCLGPVALNHPRAPWKIGLSWGFGHALGTLLLAIPALLLAQLVSLPSLASWGNRLAGFALLGMAVWSWRSMHQHLSSGGPELRSPLLVGFVHGATGAGSLLLVLPVLLAGSLAGSVLFLVAFAVGSTVAMAGLTAAIAKLGARLRPALLERARVCLTALSFGFGAYLLITA